MAGCDIEVHGGNFENAIRKVRNWLASEAGIQADGAAKIRDAWYDFQEWHYEKLEAAGFSEEDILDYSTSELLTAMREWVAIGKPV